MNHYRPCANVISMPHAKQTSTFTLHTLFFVACFILLFHPTHPTFAPPVTSCTIPLPVLPTSFFLAVLSHAQILNLAHAYSNMAFNGLRCTPQHDSTYACTARTTFCSHTRIPWRMYTPCMHPSEQRQFPVTSQISPLLTSQSWYTRALIAILQWGTHARTHARTRARTHTRKYSHA